MKKTIKKIITHLIFLIFGFILASYAIDSIICQPYSNNVNSAPFSSDLRMVNTTTPDNFFYDIDYIYYENALNISESLGQYDTAEYIYYGVNLPQTPTLSFGATIDTEYKWSLVFSFKSVKKPTLGFSVWLRKEFTLYESRILQSYNYYYTSYLEIAPTTNIIGNYKEWKVLPSTTTGDIITFQFNTGYTTSTISRPFDSVTYSVGGEQLYNAGYDRGYEAGYTDGNNIGYNAGYDKALSEGISNPEHIFYSIWAILTTCGDVLYQFFTIPLFGDISVGFVFVIIPFLFSLVEKVIQIIVKLISMLIGG